MSEGCHSVLFLIYPFSSLEISLRWFGILGGIWVSLMCFLYPGVLRLGFDQCQ